MQCALVSCNKDDWLLWVTEESSQNYHVLDKRVFTTDSKVENENIAAKASIAAAVFLSPSNWMSLQLRQHGMLSFPQ